MFHGSTAMDDGEGLRSGRTEKMYCLNHSQSCFAQTQGVSNDRNGAEAHGRARQHGAEQPAEDWKENTSRDGNAERVIEKCECQILPNILDRRAAEFSRSHNPAQVPFQQCDARILDRHVRSRTHGDAHVGSGKGWRVVNAVARHGDDAPFFAKSLYDFTFSLWLNLGFDFFNAQFLRNIQCGYSAIAGEHNDTNRVLSEGTNCFRRGGLDPI